MTSSSQVLTEVDLHLPRLSSGKVREIFDLPQSSELLLITTDRVSAFDVVMRQGIPDKGRVLCGMTLYWLQLTHDICPNHLVSTDLPAEVISSKETLAGRTMVVRKLEMLQVEFVIRGYLSGSGWKDYQRTGSVCGVPLPAGLVEAGRLPEPIFTPATKSSVGHDVNITEDEAAAICGPDLLERAKQAALEIYTRGAVHAEARGIILADTKFEFGISEGEVVLGDEVLTPDSSRFWPAASWQPGSNPPSFDKQYLRDWLDSQGWNHSPPPPELPARVVEATRSRYVEAFGLITGEPYESYLTRVKG